jgi:hypothetical protein
MRRVIACVRGGRKSPLHAVEEPENRRRSPVRTQVEAARGDRVRDRVAHCAERD